ncbi:MAG: aldo/keto reductase [Reichenbachiella sp.]|uniref:aldo/keto reductase n=1 Tax=Reichenbachiella sp. TaxID=2184521 RepID=UPI003265FCD8
MKYNRLGNSGLQVSSLCFGTMTFGDGSDEAMSQKVYAACRDKGINFFDCANVYAGGKSEEILGRLIKDHREEVVVATKGYYPMSDDVNGRGASRFHLTKALEASLNRLGTDYVDVYYIHHFDENTPLEETLSTLNDFVRQGKVLYLGLSNFAAWQIMKAIAICDKMGFAPISCIEPMYSLLKRQCESEILPLAIDQGLGVFSYSPLGGGYLTGKYLDKKGQGRFETSKMYQKRYEAETNLKTVRKFTDFAKDNDYNPVTLAIAWAASNPGITAPIVGARNLEQLSPVLDAVDFDMTDELWATIADFALAPAQPTDRSEE